MQKEEKSYKPMSIKPYHYNVDSLASKRISALRKKLESLEENTGLIVTRGEVSLIQLDWANEDDFVVYKHNDFGMTIAGLGKEK